MFNNACEGTAMRETLCSRCSHCEVCSLKSKFLAAQKAIDDFSFNVPVDKGVATTVMRLQDINWIEPIELKCAHYIRRGPVNREVV